MTFYKFLGFKTFAEAKESNVYYKALRLNKIARKQNIENKSSFTIEMLQLQSLRKYESKSI